MNHPFRLTVSVIIGCASLYSLFAGFNWTLQTSGVTARLRGVSAVNDRVAWTSGSGSTVLRTDDGGASWRAISVTTDKVDFRDIDAIDTQIAYVLSIGNGPASRIYKTLNAGATWTEQYRATDLRVFLDAMTFWDKDHGVVMGDSIDGKLFIMTTSNGGKDWARVPEAALPAALEGEGAFAASGTNIAVQSGGYAWIGTGAAPKARVLRTADFGRTWKVATTPLVAGASAGIFSVAFSDTKNGIIVGGDYGKEKEAIDNLAVTTDGGETWRLVKGLTGFRSAVAYVPLGGQQMIVAVGPSGGDFSKDDGQTWSPLDGPGFDTISFVRGAAIAWASGARGILGRLDHKL